MRLSCTILERFIIFVAFEIMKWDTILCIQECYGLEY